MGNLRPGSCQKETSAGFANRSKLPFIKRCSLTYEQRDENRNVLEEVLERGLKPAGVELFIRTPRRFAPPAHGLKEKQHYLMSLK